MGSSSDVGSVSTVGDKQSLSVDMESLPRRPCTVVLEEKIDMYQPTEEELLEYARWLGMKIPQDMDLIWIAREGLTRPLPEEWKPCQTEDDEIYYFNFETGESVWDHPCDGLCRKLYQEECMRLGKRPYRMVENASCSSQLQQLGNWDEEETHRQPTNQACYDEMVNEKETHSPERFFGQALSSQESMEAERMPSSKEIQMNIVEKEIDALKDIRAQLLQKMSALCQNEAYTPLTSQMVIERIANYNEPEQGSISLMEGNIYTHPSAEMGNCIELQPGQIGQDWNDGQYAEEKEDPRKTKERTELLRTQLEMAKIVKLQIPNKKGVANVYDIRKPYKDQSHASGSNSTPPIMYAHETSQEANSEANRNKILMDRGGHILSKISVEELKKENLVVSNRVIGKLLSHLNSIDGMEGSTFEDEYQLALSRKKEKMELLRKEWRKDIELQLLLEEESILKTKRVETLARLRNQIEGEVLAEQGSFQGVSPYVHAVSKGCQHKFGVDEDLKQLFMEWTKELKDEVVGLKSKMNEILVLNANTSQQQLESLLVLPPTSENICKASSNVAPRKKNSTEFISTLRKILGELDMNLKHLLENHGNELKSQNNVRDIVKKLEDIGLSKNLDGQSDLLHTNPNIVNRQGNSPHVISTNLLSILKEFLLVLDDEVENNISHYEEEVSQNQKSNYCPSKLVDEELDIKNNHILPMEILKIIKGIITKIETHISSVIMRQERGSFDKSLGLELGGKEFPLSNECLQPQSNFLNEEIHKLMLDMHGVVTQFKGVSMDLLSSFKEFVGELEGEMKERTQQPKREVSNEVHGLKPQFVGKGDGHDKSRGEQILSKVDDTRGTMELPSEEPRSSKELSTETLGMLEGFVGTPHQELKDRISSEEKKIQKDNAFTQMDAKPNFKHDPALQLQETRLQKDRPMFYEDEIRNKSRIQNIFSGALSTNTLSSLKGFVDELHRETTLIQPKNRNIEDQNPNLLASLETHVSIPNRGMHEVDPIPSEKDCEEPPHKQNVELQTLCVKTLSAFENFRKNLDKEIHYIFLQEGESPISKPHLLDGPSASFSKGTDSETQDRSITCKRFEKHLEAKSPSFDVMFLELKRFVGKVEELKTTIQKFKKRFKQANRGMRSKMNNIVVDEFFSKTSKSELQSHSLIPIFKAWSIQIENSKEDLLQNFKTKFIEEMNMILQKKVKDFSCLRSKNCHKFQSPKSEYQTQVQTLVTKEKRVWYDILNNVTERWLQKEWIERLEHQSELRTTNDHSTSSPSSMELTQVQNILGEEKNIIFDILNHSTHKWVIQQINLSQLEPERASHSKEGIEILSTSYKSNSEYGQSPPFRSKPKCCQRNEKLNTKKNRRRNRSHVGDILYSNEDEQSKLIIHGSKNVECCPHNFDSCYNQSKSAQEDGNRFSHKSEESQESEEAKRVHNNFTTNNNNLSPICRCNPEFGTVKQTNNLGFSQDGEIGEGYHNEKSLSQAKVFLPLHEICKDPSFKCENNNRHTCRLSTSNFDKNSKFYSEGKLFESANARESQGIYCKIHVPRSISQLKLVSRKGWQTLQSKLRVANAKRRAHIVFSWIFQQKSCGLLPKRDTSYLAYTVLKFIKTAMGKMACGKTHQSPDVETLQVRTGRDYDAENTLVDVSITHIMPLFACDPLMKPQLPRSGQMKFESKDQTTSPIKEVYYDKHNPSTQEGDEIYNSTKWKKHGYSPKMVVARDEFQWNNDKEFYKAESITDSFAKFQCDNDLEMSIIENTQCDCETPIMRGVNSKEVDMHELEEAINNLRKSKEIEANDTSMRIDHYPLNDNDFVVEKSHPPNTLVIPFQQREKCFAENLDLTNEFHINNVALYNNRKHQENGKNGSLKGKIPSFITFEFLQQGEISFPKNRG